VRTFEVTDFYTLSNSTRTLLCGIYFNATVQPFMRRLPAFWDKFFVDRANGPHHYWGAQRNQLA